MKTEIEKRASKFIDETDMMQFSTMEIMVMFAEKEIEQLRLSEVSSSLKETSTGFEVWLRDNRIETMKDGDFKWNDMILQRAMVIEKYKEAKNQL